MNEFIGIEQYSLRTYAQLFVLIAILLVFFAGVWSKGILGSHHPMTKKEYIAFMLVGFFVLVLPLGPTVYQSINVDGSNMFVVLSAFIPSFFAGLMSRSEIQKLMANIDAGPVAEAP